MSLVIVIIRLKSSLSIWSKVIALSGFYCTKNIESLRRVIKNDIELFAIDARRRIDVEFTFNSGPILRKTFDFHSRSTIFFIFLCHKIILGLNRIKKPYCNKPDSEMRIALRKILNIEKYCKALENAEN